MTKVLIVDDAAFMRISIKNYLARNNFEVIGEAENGVVAIEKYKELRPDVVVIDPPRKGCQKELFDLFDDLGINRIVYISCDAATLARDAAILSEKGFEAARLKAVDLFPRTVHCEAVALFERE
jgi:23S rRNA (uracil1939-C5)-methyltransferase